MPNNLLPIRDEESKAVREIAKLGGKNIEAAQSPAAM